MTHKEFFEYIEKQCNKILTKEQKDAVIYNEGNHCIQSTAGSGKTTVICCKIAFLILVKGLAPSEISVVSFSKLSAADLKVRFIEMFGEIITEEVRCSTIHSFANSIISDYEIAKNIKYTRIENSKAINKKALIKEIAEECTGEKVDDEIVSAIITFLSYIRNMMILQDKLDYYEDDYPIECFKEIYIKYSKILIENKYLDYDSMLTMANHILNINKEIKDKYQNQYKYYLCDESQDNSKIQNNLLKILAGKGTICMVGDSDQLIYGWRGVEFNEFRNFEKLFKNSKVLFMDQNFRSSANIVYLANKFIKINQNRYDKRIYTLNADGEEISVIETENKEDQMDYIIDILKNSDGNYNKYAILYRNNISAIEVINKLMHNSIEFSVKDDLVSFFHNIIVKDILSFIEFAKDTTNSKEFMNIVNKGCIYIKKDVLNKIRFNDNKCVLHTLLESKFVSEEIKVNIKELKLKLNVLRNIEPIKFINFIEEDLNYKKYLEWYSKTFNYGQDTIEYIFSTLKSICNTLDVRYRLRVIQDKIVNSKDNKEGNTIKLTTIHSSKGLEWDEVFLIDSHMIPTRIAILEKNEGRMATYEEEVRAFFVAITRPRKKLHIIQPRSVNDTAVNGSSFVQEVKRILRYQKLERKNQERREQYLMDVKNDRTYAKRENRYKLDDFKVGTRIKHKSYGICEFVEIDEETMIGTVRLKNGFNQNISISSCMKGIIVKIID